MRKRHPGRIAALPRRDGTTGAAPPSDTRRERPVLALGAALHRGFVGLRLKAVGTAI